MTTGDLCLQVQILLQLGYPTQQIRTVNLSAQIWPLALAENVKVYVASGRVMNLLYKELMLNCLI